MSDSVKSGIPRLLWKGAVNFGLVHIPVALYPAVKRDDIDFDWIDRRDMKPVGYKRVNKETGKEVLKENIVRGYQYEHERYVVLSDEEIKNANPRGTQSVDILAFADFSELSSLYLETPYYLAPTQRGEKVYALLREALKRANKIGIAHVVIQTKQHLAALIPAGPVLVLNTLRWASEVRSPADLKLPDDGQKANGIRDNELSMASQLINDMTEKFEIAKYRDTFRDDIMVLVNRKIKAGKTQVVTETPSEEAEQKSSNVIDLTELLKRSLRSGNRTPAAGRDKTSTARKSARADTGQAKKEKAALKRKRV